MAETMGSLIDKICISELKIYHMNEQIDRKDVDESHRDLCRNRVQVLTVQRDDLLEELRLLWQRWLKGEWTPKIYRQYKMYNDARFRIKRD